MKSVQTLREFMEAVRRIREPDREFLENKLYMKGAFFDFEFDLDGMIPEKIYETSAKIEEIIRTSFADRIWRIFLPFGRVATGKCPPYKVEGIEIARDSAYVQEHEPEYYGRPVYYGMIYAVNEGTEAEIQLWARQEMPKNKYLPEELQKQERWFRFEMHLPIDDIDRDCTRRILTEIWPLIHHFETQPSFVSSSLLSSFPKREKSDYDQIPHRRIIDRSLKEATIRRSRGFFHADLSKERGVGYEKECEHLVEDLSELEEIYKSHFYYTRFGLTEKGADVCGIKSILYYLNLELPQKAVFNRWWRVPPEMLYGGD